ncbi:J domain-containing protein [Hyalangium rubrum]|uniref:DnaJ domain-containing protein n=1 Tax=Hyalangium rubrum TaxID=3103134 RepID=A0ABU5GY46_9BACT|nr:DnaJ domain-containing protein [Hyalangium sp. s54d21]MDY7224770.1 DnaJ domain-containing protein [Hyalangium sp. s54d21]
MPELVDLTPEQQKEIIELERVQEGQDHFALLGVRPGASAEEVKQAFHDFSKRYHPDRFADRNLGTFRARIERIYRRVSEAYSVLSNPERREAYLKAHAAKRPPTPAPGVSQAPIPDVPLKGDEERRPERQARLARHPYLAHTHRLTDLLARGKAAMSKGDFERAYADLNQVVNLDPKNREATTMLAEVRRKHDEQRGKLEFERGLELEKQHDIAKALESYRKACTLDPQNGEAAFRAARAAKVLGLDWNEVRMHAQRAVDLAPDKVPQRLFLAQVLLDGKAGNLAKRHLQEVLKLDPKNVEANALLRKSRWPF